MRNARAAVGKNIKNATEPRALTSYDVLECVDVGNEFEVLRVTSRAPNTGAHRYWLCRCECGKERAIREYSLTSGAIGSCGCSRKRIWREIGKANRIHGHSFGGRGSKWSQLPSALRVELSRYSIRDKWDRRGRRGKAFKRARRERIRINAARRKTGPPGLIH